MRMKPLVRSAFRSDVFSTTYTSKYEREKGRGILGERTHFRAARQSVSGVGNVCSGIKLGEIS